MAIKSSSCVTLSSIYRSKVSGLIGMFFLTFGCNPEPVEAAQTSPKDNIRLFDVNVAFRSKTGGISSMVADELNISEDRAISIIHTKTYLRAEVEIISDKIELSPSDDEVFFSGDVIVHYTDDAVLFSDKIIWNPVYGYASTSSGVCLDLARL